MRHPHFLLTLPLLVASLAGCDKGGHPSPTSSESPDLDPGFKVFPTPRTFDGPGTVFRIDKRSTKFPVTILKVNASPAGTEELPARSKSVNWSASALATFIGAPQIVQDTQGSFKADSTLNSAISFGQGTRERTDDEDVTKAIKVAHISFKDHKDSKYYVIRETIAVSSISVVIERSAGLDAKAKATIKQVIDSRADIKLSDADRQTLTKTFQQPHRVFYTAEEILPPGSGLEANSEPRLLPLRPNQTLSWDEEVEGTE
jgi:hypothetical protein